MYKVNKKHFRAMPKNVALVSFYSLWTFNWCLVYWKNTKIDHIDNAVLFFFHYSLSADFSRCCSIFIIDSELDFACWKDILLMGSFSSKSFAYVLMNEWLSAKFNSLSANPTKWRLKGQVWFYWYSCTSRYLRRNILVDISYEIFAELLSPEP